MSYHPPAAKAAIVLVNVVGGAATYKVVEVTAKVPACKGCRNHWSHGNWVILISFVVGLLGFLGSLLLETPAKKSPAAIKIGSLLLIVVGVIVGFMLGYRCIRIVGAKGKLLTLKNVNVDFINALKANRDRHSYEVDDEDEAESADPPPKKKPNLSKRKAQEVEAEEAEIVDEEPEVVDEPKPRQSRPSPKSASSKRPNPKPPAPRRRSQDDDD